MEGAAGTLQDLNDGWVRKTMRRGGASSLPVENQVSIQQWLHRELQPAKGYKALFAPNARPFSRQAFDLEKVEAGTPLQFAQRPDAADEVVRLWCTAYEAGYILNDLEYYEQADGSIAVLDVDKVCLLDSRQQIYSPFKGCWTLVDLVKQAAFTEKLALQILEGIVVLQE